jgi:hypothetical protein
MSMSRLRASLLGLTLATFPLAAGCGGRSDEAKENLKQQASGKLDAMKQLADAVARNAPPGEVSGLVESFVSNDLDVKAHPDEARQIVEIYNTRVKGKLRGEHAGQVQAIIDGIQKDLKR